MAATRHAALLSWALLSGVCLAEESSWGPYIEPDFPFFSTMLDGRALGPEFPNNNLTPRGIVLNLGHGAFLCFDQDLLRMAIGWVGEGVTPESIPMASYHQPHRKAAVGQEKLPKPIGKPVFGTGVHPGVFMGEKPSFVDPRMPGRDESEVGRGPLENGRLNWVNLGGRLSYGIGSATVTEAPLAHAFEGLVAFERRFLAIESAEPLTFALGERALVDAIETSPGRLVLRHGDEVTVYAYASAAKFDLRVIDQRRVVVTRHPMAAKGQADRGFVWRGSASDAGKFGQFLERELANPTEPKRAMPDWNDAVATKAKLGDDSQALVFDEIELPLANPWKRNVRPSGLAFWPDGTLAICTIDGDVWLAKGLKAELAEVTWRRVASGLHEPQSIVIRDGLAYVFTRNGIVRLECRNPSGGPALIHRVFCDRFGQTAETREYPMDMVLAKNGDFYIAKGGQQETRPGKHNGRVLRVSKDGKTVEEIASGLRQPYLGYHPETGLLTCTDQQGHYVPSTPIRVIKPGDYYGYYGTGPLPEPPVAPPLCWIPHPINQSAAGQVWAAHRAISVQMGELNGRLLHLGYHRPAIFAALVDDSAEPAQGGVVPLATNLDIPLLKGALNPADGFVYLTGFQIWGTSAAKLAMLVRLRPGKKPLHSPTRAITGKQGVLLTFPHPLKAASVTPANFLVQRWNYVRRPEYGSGHFKLDGTPGQERLPVVAARLSSDKKSIFLGVPDMRPAMQFTVDYDLRAEDGDPVANALYLTIHALRDLDPEALGFGKIDLSAPPPVPVGEQAAAKPSAETGKRLAETLGCLGCHSVNGSMEGMKGPTWKGLFGSERELTTGEKVKADEGYLRESILDPNKKVTKGFQAGETGMPPYRGILEDAQVESLLLYLSGLAD